MRYQAGNAAEQPGRRDASGRAAAFPVMAPLAAKRGTGNSGSKPTLAPAGASSDGPGQICRGLTRHAHIKPFRRPSYPRREEVSGEKVSTGAQRRRADDLGRPSKVTN
jgi:hypothetical protein